MFRKFDEPKVEYTGAFEGKNIFTWVDETAIPTLINFNDDSVETIFHKKKSTIFFFRDDQSAEQKTLVEEFNKAAIINKGKLLFSVSGIRDGMQKKVADYVGVASTPKILIVDFQGNAVDKYQYAGSSSEFTADQITNFINDFKAKKLHKFLKSEDIPATNDEPVKVVVGKNFNEIVRDSDDDVLLEFYAPWCGHCKQLAPKYDELAKDLKDVKGLVIAKIDSTQNEIDGVSVSGFPTIKFFAKGSK